MAPKSASIKRRGVRDSNPNGCVMPASWELREVSTGAALALTANSLLIRSNGAYYYARVTDKRRRHHYSATTIAARRSNTDSL